MTPGSRFRKGQLALLGVLSTAILFSEFYANALNVAAPGWFASSQQDTQAHVIGRIVKSRQDGFFSAGGLTGWGSPLQSIPDSPVDQWPDQQSIDFQYRAYREGLTFNSYKPYLSQPGGQAFCFGLLDWLLPLTAEAKLELFYVLTCLLSASVLALVVVWFFLEFGWCVAIFTLVSLVFAQFLVVFGRNLWWSIWAFYLPMVGVMYFLRHDRTATKRHHIRCGILVFVLTALKCWINGFEFITTTVVMMLVPFIYYWIRDGTGARATLKRLFVATSFAGLAILFSVVVLCFQVAAVKGGSARWHSSCGLLLPEANAWEPADPSFGIRPWPRGRHSYRASGVPRARVVCGLGKVYLDLEAVGAFSDEGEVLFPGASVPGGVGCGLYEEERIHRSEPVAKQLGSCGRDLVFHSGPLVLVRRLQGPFLRPHPHQLPHMADALHDFRFRRMRTGRQNRQWK